MGSVAANRNEGIEMFVNSIQNPLATTFGLVEVVARGAEQGATLGDHSLEVARNERAAGVVRRQSRPSIGDANDFVTVAYGHLTNRTNSGIESGRVASSRQNTDSHCTSSKPNLV